MKRFGLLMISLFLICAFFPLIGHADNAGVVGYAWVDKDGDGILSKEKGLEGVSVSLEKKQENGNTEIVGTFVTGQDGIFTFGRLGKGEYRLVFQAPKGYCYTYHGIDSMALPSDSETSVTPFFTLGENERRQINAGVSRSSTYISLVAFYDNNGNGGRMSAEGPVSGVRFTLLYEFNGQIYEIASGTTNSKGECVFRNLPHGAYTLRADLPENLTAGPMGEKLNTFNNCFLPGDNNTAYSVPFTIAYKDSIGLAIGVVRTGSLMGSLRFDADSNGVWDADEGNVPGAQIILKSDNMQNPLVAVPDEQGEYLFSNLQPGAFQLIFHLPDGYLFSVSEASLLHSTSNEDALKVFVQEESTTDIGAVMYAKGASVLLKMTEDANINGVSDADERPISGAFAELIQNDRVLGSTVTAEDGTAFFPTARFGDAVLHVILPDGYVFADTLEKERVEVVRIAQEQSAFALCAARSAAVTGMLFDDPANIGIYDGASSPLSGFTVAAVDINGKVAAQAVTDADGAYRLDGLLPTEYRILFLLDDNYIAAPHVENGTGHYNHIAAQTPDYGATEPVIPPYGGVLEHIDGAVFRAGIVDGYVLSNENHDDLATNEGGVPGITAVLIDENGLPVSDYSYAVSDETGHYVIKGVLPGRYAVSYRLPEHCAFSAPLTDSTEIRTEYFQMSGGSEQRLQPIGAVQTASVAGGVYRFSNYDPIENVHIKFVSDFFGTVQEFTTGADGLYRFDDMRPDTYVLSITLPDNNVFAEADWSITSGKNSNSVSMQAALKHGQIITDAYIAADLPAAVSGLLFFDRNMNGIPDADETPVVGREAVFSLNGKPVLTLNTDENGSFFADSLIPAIYQFSVPLKSNEVLLDESLAKSDWLVPVTAETSPIVLPVMAFGTISGQVWNLDNSAENIQEIPVVLLSGSNEPVGTTLTGESGAFSFDGLLPGTYTLNMELPEGYLFAKEQDAVNRSSYIQSGNNGKPYFLPIKLDIGEYKAGIDVGMGANGAVGDYAWLDTNQNGMQDIGEPPVPGILIEMYKYGEFVTSTTTDGIGFYRLENLYPGEYEMRVTVPKELKPTMQQLDFPMVGSILPEADSEVVSVSVTVPSGGENIRADLGFVLKKKDVYPACMEDITVKNWMPYAER